MTSLSKAFLKACEPDLISMKARQDDVLKFVEHSLPSSHETLGERQKAYREGAEFEYIHIKPLLIAAAECVRCLERVDAQLSTAHILFEEIKPALDKLKALVGEK